MSTPKSEVKCPFLWAFPFCPFLLGIWAFEQSLIVWLLVSGRRRSHAKDRAAIEVGQQGIVVQSQPGNFVTQQLDLHRVGNADLEDQRFAFCFFGSIKRCACFITQCTEPLTIGFIDITSE